MTQEWREQYDPEDARIRLKRDVERLHGGIYHPQRYVYRRPMTWIAKPLPVGDQLLLVAFVIAVLTIIGVVATY